MEPDAPSAVRPPISHRMEVFAVVILSVATVCSAWSAYEATRWSGDQAINGARASALRTESTRLSNEANIQTAVDIQVFTAWVTAVSEKNAERAEFLRARFRNEFKPAFDAWLASAPPGTIPDGTPFMLPEYRLVAAEEASALLKQAEVAQARAADANQISDNFVLTTVLFATVLFFAGIASRMQTVAIRRAVLFIALGIWAVAVVILFTLPQNIGF
jgi:hypothetical protein